MDPEQIYQEVLQEEQQKGTSPAVAEGRAKAARQRAIQGSPHPKEPKWWPGAQPHFEDGAAPAAEEPVAGEPAAEEPAAEEAPAAEEPAAEEAPAAEAEQPAPAAQAEEPAPAAQAEEPAPAAQAEQPAPAAEVAPSPAAEAAPQPAAVATAEVRPTELPPEARPAGVRHGVPTGTRLRPEDAVSTEAQFDGQRAMEQRRKLIDELVQTGVPVVTAARTGEERSPWISLLFLLIPLLAVGFLVANREDLGGGTSAAEEQRDEGPVSGPNSIVAEGSQFNKDTLTFTAGEETEFEFANLDQVQHNLAIYETQEDADAQSNALFNGVAVTGTTTTYTIPPLDKGEYIFLCNFHPASMAGSVTVE